MDHIILHVPHASLYIPNDISFSDGVDIEKELLFMTDRYTDELFAMPGITMLKSPVSRLVVDMERFRNDNEEVMSGKGMGAVYEKTVDGKKLRDLDAPLREALLKRYYDPYHKAFNDQVEDCLAKHGYCLIIDCHSFPSKPLPCDLNQND